MIATAAGTAAATAPSVATDGRAAYVPLTPCRLGDTRVAGLAPAVVDSHTLRISLIGRCGIPAAASAVAISIAVTDTKSSGFADVTAAGRRGKTSTVNWTAGETRSASTVVAGSANGAVDVYVSTGVAAVNVVVDVTGHWEPVAGPVAQGRMKTLESRRVLDTRVTNERLQDGETLTVGRRLLGVPADATAVTGNLTATAGSGAGYLTAFSAGGALPLASNVNTDAASQDRASGVIIPISAAGLAIYAGSFDTDVVFDVTGYVTGPSEQAATEGLLVLTDRTRILDTRTTGQPTTTLANAAVFGLQGMPIGGIIGTIAATDATAGGYASIRSGGATGGSPGAAETSSVNWANAGAVASMIIQRVSETGQLRVTASTPAALIIDITAYLLAEPTALLPVQPSAPLTPVATQPAPTPTTVPPPAVSTTTPHEIATGTITDQTGDGKPTGDPIDLLRQTFTENELAAGGGVNIVYFQPPGGAQLMVPYNAKAFPVCSPQPMCILINEPYWVNPGSDPVNSNRVMISHEWAHVLFMRYQTYLSSADYGPFVKVYNMLNEECLADAVASIVLARGGFKPNETPDYTIHYSCDEWWIQEYGAGRLAEMQALSVEVANDLLTWAEGWGATH